MTSKDNIENLLKNHITVAAFVLNERGNVISFNDAGNNYLPNIEKGLQFFHLFETDASKSVEKLFLKSKNSKEIVNEDLSFQIEGAKEDYNVAITPLYGEGEQEFILTIERSEKSLHKSRTEKFTIHTTEIEELIDSEELLDIIQKIKTSFPFTFIGKTKFQKDIDNLEEDFWIKDPKGKFIIVNRKFSVSLGMKSSQIEGQLEKELLPKYMVKLYNTIDAYIIDTTNSVFMDRISSHAQNEKSEIMEIIQFPITDLDQKVVAIVGMSRKKLNLTNGSSDSLITQNNLIKEISKAVLIVNEENVIISYSNSIVKYLPVKETDDLIGESLQNMFDKDSLTEINKYRESISKDRKELKFTYKDSDGNKKEIRIFVKKIYNESDIFLGMSIEFEDKSEGQSELELKGNLYDVIMQTNPEAMFVYDIDNLKFLEVNDAALKLYGYKRNVFLNMDLTDLYAPEDIQTLIDSPESKRTTVGFTGPWKHKKSDGSSILVELSKSNFKYNQRNAHLNIVRDVSEQIKKDKNYQLYKSTYNGSNDLIITTDKDGFITQANGPAQKLLGVTKKDYNKRPFLSLVSDDDRANVNSIVFHSGEKNSQTMNVELKMESDELQEAEINATPLTDYKGEIESFNLVIQREPDYKPSVVESSPSSEGGSVDAPFLSNVFHELLTPINVIIGFVEELQTSIETPSDDQAEAIQIIKDNQKLLLQLMDNAVEYSQLEKEQIKLKPESLLFTNIIDDLRDNVKKIASVNKVEFAYGKISSSLKFHTDRLRVTSLLTLFIKFAIQITKENKVFLSAYQIDDENCVISLKDKRNGISDILVKGLTEVFTEDENQVRKNFGFSRFTVKLTQRLVQLLAGKIELIKKRGSVAEYGIVLPIEFKGKYGDEDEIPTVLLQGEEIPITQPETAPTEKTVATQSIQESINVNVNVTAPEKTEEKPPAEEETPPVVEETPPVVEEAPPVVEEKPPPAEPKPAPEPVREVSIDIKSLSCLYVEDQVDSQILFKVQMKDLKSTEFAASFEEAIPLIKSRKFDFIVLDINLQGEYNGLDALRIIQKLPGYETTPIIAVTAYVLPGDREKFIAAGFHDFISKPILRDKIVDVLNRVF
ncbi:PAS domain S-box protein [Bacteroidota bacterium]